MSSILTLGDRDLTADDVGARWRVTGLDGWLGRSMRRNRVERSGAAGSYPSSGNATEAQFTIRGMAVFSSAEDAAVERRELMSVAESGAVEMTVTDAAGFGSRLVEVDAVFASLVRDSMFTYVITCTAVDPLLYGLPLYGTASLASTAAGTGLMFPLAFPLDFGVPAGVTPGAVDLPNAGTATYWPTLRIDSPTSNPTVRAGNTGDFITYNGTLTAGQWLDVDCANRRVLLNGSVSVRRQVSSGGSWLGVAPGGDSLTWTDDSGDAAALLSVSAFEGAWS